ncbi:Uncharacterized protein FWK35_00021376, partial [Aphis craccivora]
MLCFFFFLSVYTRKNASISTLGVVSDSKMNLVGALGGHFLNFSIVFKNAGNNGNFYAKTSFRPK